MTKMMRPKLVLSMLVFACGFCLGNVLQPWSAVHAQPTMRVFEIRTYTAAEGKLDALHARFRDHTLALFKKHGMTSVGYFKPQTRRSSRTRSSTSWRIPAARLRRRLAGVSKRS